MTMVQWELGEERVSVSFLPLIMRPVGGRGGGRRTVKEGRGEPAGWLVG